jgi:tRNA(His) 5'-end guanylyltransferase
MRDELGDRMKGQYEDRTRYSLPRRTYTIIRLDGKAFHTYTRGLRKPFDKELFEDIDNAIIAMLPEVQGSVFAYTQSDEISILLADFATPTTSAWFDALLQKMASVSASIITAEFNRQRILREAKLTSLTGDFFNKGPGYIANAPIAYFDARVFTIPDRIEVMNYFIWRNQDCSRNSVSMVAQANFSHKELQGKSTTEMHEMLHAKGVNWATDYTDREKNGALIVKESYQASISIPDTANFKVNSAVVERTRWVSKGAWKFTEDKDALLAMIPTYPA